MQYQQFEIEPMTENDLESVARIESQSGLNNWGIENYKSELKRNDSFLYTAKLDQETVGFVFARLITPEVEIFNIAVIDEHKKKGIGKKLFEQLLEKATENDCQKCWLEVRESNQTARKFYEKLKFQIVGRRKNYYQFPIEDALLLECIINK
jgi:ribosomal-protein-alanine N-acetyltransferase